MVKSVYNIKFNSKFIQFIPRLPGNGTGFSLRNQRETVLLLTHITCGIEGTGTLRLISQHMIPSQANTVLWENSHHA